MELRRQSELAEKNSSEEGDEASSSTVKKKTTASASKTKTKTKTTRKTAKKKAPERMRVQWGVFNGSMQRVAIFDYADRDAADAKASKLSKTAKGNHFVQVVKEPIEEDSDA